MSADNVKPMPCPFCGGTHFLIEKFSDGERMVWCQKCRTMGPGAPTESEAVALWNKPNADRVACVASGIEAAEAGWVDRLRALIVRLEAAGDAEYAACRDAGGDALDHAVCELRALLPEAVRP